MEARPKTRTPYPRTMNFTLLKEAFILMITMYLVYGLNIQEQNRRLLKNYCIVTINFT